MRLETLFTLSHAIAFGHVMQTMVTTTSEPAGAAPSADVNEAEAFEHGRPSAAPLLHFEQAFVGHGDNPAILAGIDFSLAAGAVQTIVGPRGSGKTTLCNVVSGLHPPSQGRLTIFGHNVTDLSSRKRTTLRRRLGIIDQQPHLLDHLSVLDNVLLPFVVRRQLDNESQSDAIELLRWIGLGERLSVPTQQLSWGERHCTAIARALVCKPSLVVADEPFAPLDPTAARRVSHLLREMNSFGLSLLIATREAQPDLDPSPLFLSSGTLLASPDEKRPAS